MPSAFCPRCGDSLPNPEADLCNECFAEEVEPVDVPDEETLRVCSKCGSYVHDGDWISSDEAVPEADLALESVKDSVRAHVDARDPQVALGVSSDDPNVYEVTVDFSAVLRGYPVTEEFEVPVNVSRETCPTCSKISGGYYESVVQVRADGREPSDEEMEHARELAYSIAGRDYSDRDTFVSKIDEVDDGIDIYMSTSMSGLEIARRLTEEFGGSYDDSPELVGEEDGQEINRVTYSVRLPEFVEGDVLALGNGSEDEEHVLVKRGGTPLKATDLETGKTTRYSLDDTEVEKVARSEDAVETTVVSVDRSRGTSPKSEPDDGEEVNEEIQVLDPETHETTTVRCPPFVSPSQGGSVTVVKTRGRLLLLPDD